MLVIIFLITLFSVQKKPHITRACNIIRAYVTYSMRTAFKKLSLFDIKRLWNTMLFLCCTINFLKRYLIVFLLLFFCMDFKVRKLFIFLQKPQIVVSSSSITFSTTFFFALFCLFFLLFAFITCNAKKEFMCVHRKI